MSGIEAVFFDCDGTLVDSEVICSRAYVAMFREFGITLDLDEVFKRFKGVKLYEIIDIINAEHGVDLAKTDLEPVYRAEVARLFDSELEVIAGANALLDAMTVPICVVSNGPVSKMQHSLGKLDAAPLPGKIVQRLRYSTLEARSCADVPCGKRDERQRRELYSGG